MGKSNLECADAVMARKSHIFVADTLSEQNKNQLTAWGVEFLELKSNGDCVGDFRGILKRLEITYKD
ncbi:hypothetical protein HHE02_13810 [Helicobacter heilmannii]|uniref:Uncharacterized protein n=1 Tax=Helicobacter heilmannii TaxID=35817 RepID=A0A0K2XNC6_HELHE|nr:hypothetical protein ASB1_14050 [Helicobacter heilmannii]CCM10889.1 hypothetical protein BN341_18760 [Helicobacter heilmannii ASB1.4]CRF48073.1 hypothetical protein HHE02_13810 [Helicobacter heilmannii]CRF50923.1 hypothetical protein HHE06_07810 [Helicobacter heilmannii]CRI33721.1 hypothetical protein HHE01_14070 [Helicobacter heilmannii]